MRLIDADALMEYCSNQKSKTISNNDIARFPTAEAVPKEDFDVLKKNYDMISSLLKEEHAKAVGTDTEPLVQVSEVTYSDRPHGKWMHSEDILEVECSNCGWPVLDIDQRGLPTFRKKAWHFCPNCGADMRGAK